MNNFNYKNLCPFKWFVLQNFPFIEADFDAITNYQLYCKVVEYLNKVIEDTNKIGNQVEDLTNSFIELQNYVNNYFENLDIQEEVNNKLDEMAEGGELANIIAQFLNANCILKFNNMQELINSESLVNGNIVGVFGDTNINDGFVNYYLITNETTDIALNNNLYAKIIYNEKVDGSYLIDEIKQYELYNENSKSTVQIFHIPNKDKFNKTIELKHGFANDIVSNTPANEKPTTFSNRKNATLCINASIFDIDSNSQNYNRILGLIIHNGVVVTDTRQYYGGSDLYKNRYILGLKNNGLLQAYVGNEHSQNLIDDGVVESWQGFIPVLINGENNRENLLNKHNWTAPVYTITSDNTPIANKIYYILENGEYVGKYNISSFDNNYTYYEQTTGGRYPRQIIAQNGTTKDFYILSANGKGKTENLGLTFEEVITLLKYVDENITFAYALDEGGSTATIFDNINRINPTDSQTIYSSQTNGIGFNERRVADFIYFSKNAETEKDKDINYLLHQIEELKKDVRRLRLDQDINNIVRSGSGLHLQNWNKSALNNLFIEFSQLQNDDTLKAINSIVSSPETALGSMNFYDIENTRTVIRALRTGHILVNEDNSGLAEISNIFAKTKVVSSFNDLRNTGFSIGYGSTTGAPFTDNQWRVNFVLSIFGSINDNIGCQIGFFGGGIPTQFAYRCFINGSIWTEWKYINFDT